MLIVSSSFFWFRPDETISYRWKEHGINLRINCPLEEIVEQARMNVCDVHKAR